MLFSVVPHHRKLSTMVNIYFHFKVKEYFLMFYEVGHLLFTGKLLHKCSWTIAPWLSGELIVKEPLCANSLCWHIDWAQFNWSQQTARQGACAWSICLQKYLGPKGSFFKWKTQMSGTLGAQYVCCQKCIFPQRMANMQDFISMASLALKVHYICLFF